MYIKRICLIIFFLSVTLSACHISGNDEYTSFKESVEDNYESISDGALNSGMSDFNDEVICFSILDGETLIIDKGRLQDEYGLNRLDNRWEPDEVDIILNSMKGTWTIDGYVGFVDQGIYFPDLFDHNNNISEDEKEQLYDMYNEKVTNAKSNIPELFFSIKEEKYHNAKNNLIYSKNADNDISIFSPIRISLSIDRWDDNYPVFVDTTTISTDFVVEYPVIYIVFFTVVEDGYWPATLVVSADNHFYILIDGAFYSLIRFGED